LWRICRLFRSKTTVAAARLALFTSLTLSLSPEWRRPRYGSRRC
jgi:hypothetical protein